jgi:hypothetical protein
VAVAIHQSLPASTKSPAGHHLRDMRHSLGPNPQWFGRGAASADVNLNNVTLVAPHFSCFCLANLDLNARFSPFQSGRSWWQRTVSKLMYPRDTRRGRPALPLVPPGHRLSQGPGHHLEMTSMPFRAEIRKNASFPPDPEPVPLATAPCGVSDAERDNYGTGKSSGENRACIFCSHLVRWPTFDRKGHPSRMRAGRELLSAEIIDRVTKRQRLPKRRENDDGYQETGYG